MVSYTVAVSVFERSGLELDYCQATSLESSLNRSCTAVHTQKCTPPHTASDSWLDDNNVSYAKIAYFLAHPKNIWQFDCKPIVKYIFNRLCAVELVIGSELVCKFLGSSI